MPLFASINPFAKYASCVTSLIVESASGLVNPDPSKRFDTYVCIKCEGQKLVGRVFKDSLSPLWKTSSIFYRFQKNKPIKIEVINHFTTVISFDEFFKCEFKGLAKKTFEGRDLWRGLFRCRARQ